MRALWTNEAVSFSSASHTVTDAGLNPLPIQRPIPVWMGGGTDIVLRRMARLADGWIPTFGFRDADLGALERLRRYVSEAGRDDSTSGLDGHVDARLADEERWIGDVDSAAEPHREYPMRGRVDLGDPGWRDVLKVIPQGVVHPIWAARFVRDYRRRSLAGMVTRPDGKPITMFEMTALTLKASPVWEDLPWIHEQWGGPIVIKGILSAENARRAIDGGASAIVVSNHGGNILDGLPATVRMLPEIVAAVGGEVEVLLDGGVRRGTDVIKAVALGARAVLIGRSYV
jgi:alkanesulfonate monooxygenase SsuD/methylene tetrahydromethanopterin reductase-like flavin-dependent oxidoreductase (luciferase family)